MSEKKNPTQELELEPIDIKADVVEPEPEPAQELELEPVDEVSEKSLAEVHKHKAVATQATEKSEGMQMLDLIRQMATDPAFDPAKMQQIIDMRKDIFMESARIEFNRAMSRAQKAMPAVARDAENTQTDSMYATLDAIVKAISPHYLAEGFALSFDQELCPIAEKSDKGWFRVVCEVSHEAGYTKKFHVDLPPDIAGIQGGINKTAVHAAKSTISYSRNMLVCMIFNVTLKEEDDDGNAAGGNAGAPPAIEYVNAEQVAIINNLIVQAGMTVDEFLKRARAQSIETIPEDMFQTAVTTLQRRVAIATRGDAK